MILLTAPSAEPVTTDDAALAARLYVGDPLLPLLPGLITSARQIAEHETGLQLMAQTWRSEFAAWPAADDEIRVHRATAAAITYWDGSSWATLSTAAYTYFPLGNGTGVAPVIGGSWPNLADVAGGPRVRIDLTAGLPSADGVEECVKLFIKALVAHWISSPEAATARTLSEAPFLGSLLDPVRLWG